MDPSASPVPPSPPTPTDGSEMKKRDKVRSAWISFIGRIVAQIVGAVASITLAILFLQRAQGPETTSAPDEPLNATARAGAARTDGLITLAVLPLSNYSGQPDQDYFADGMTEALIADLAQLEGLRVISRTSAMQYRNQTKSLPVVAKELGADMIVEGSVLRAGGRIRITAQLIDARSDHHVWARSYEHTIGDVLKLQGLVASEIAREVKGALTPTQQGRLAQRRAVDPAVYDLYLRGRHAWNLRTADGFATAVTDFEQAIQRDPMFALAYAGLSDVYVLPTTRPALGAPGDARAKALKAVTRALELDDSLAEAHTSRAALYFFHERNLAAAEASFRRAIELNPGYPTARQWYAILLAEQGRDAEALAQAREAITLDPLAGPMRQALGLVHYYGRRFPEAVTESRRAMELAPQLPLAGTIVAKALFLQKAYPAAVAAAAAVASPQAADALAIHGLAMLRAGDTANAAKVLTRLRELEPLPVVPLAQWYAVTGQANEAFAVLTRGSVSGAQPLVAIDPLFDGIRADPRFARLVTPITRRD